MKNTTTLHNIYNPNQSKDIGDDVFDWYNCFEFEELKTSANDSNIDDNYNNVMLWLADSIEVVDTNDDFIICKISQFLDDNREIIDEFLNQVYKPEYQPQNNGKIESGSEEFYDYYLEGVFGGLINGNFSYEDYATLWRIICEHKAKNSTLRTKSQKMQKMTKQIDALHYAKYLTSEKHANALDMVKNVPQNVYIEDWKREEKNLAKKCEYLDELENDLQADLYRLCEEIESERKEQRQIIANYVISNLSSAYQESAIDEAFDEFNDTDNEPMTAQEFTDACCEHYREQLKGAGYSDQTGATSIYKGFAKYGDECQIQAVAFVLYGIITR